MRDKANWIKAVMVVAMLATSFNARATGVRQFIVCESKPGQIGGVDKIYFTWRQRATTIPEQTEAISIQVLRGASTYNLDRIFGLAKSFDQPGTLVLVRDQENLILQGPGNYGVSKFKISFNAASIPANPDAYQRGEMFVEATLLRSLLTPDPHGLEPKTISIALPVSCNFRGRRE